uniref:DNA-directed RNA polymerase subunit beta' n=1 Tax=Pseudopediastrum sp. CL0201VA TaxID=2184484 RepID=A0A2U8GJK7_9CHLO|nr:beta subunit of RNA polymerase [Pseudopediastrum sp. CL0201VA]AWI68854.1 beta subunit of RNA polymerase [Pseudopediastrum sp. CL0201VA]
MNTYSNLLKKENISIKKNQIIKSSSKLRLVFFKKEKYGFFFIKKKLKNQIFNSTSNNYSIICSATKEQTNYFNENSKLNNPFTLQKNKVDYRFQIYNSLLFGSKDYCESSIHKKPLTSSTFSESKIQLVNKVYKQKKEKKNYNLNFLKKLNCFNFLLKKNTTNKWVNWVNDVNFESFNKIGSFTSELQVQKNKEQNPLSKNLYKSGYSKIHELKLVRVEIASPEKIKEWAEKVLPNGKVFGEVTNANTLHYKTFKPHKGGLFCERIFGPLKDFECACGVRSKPIELESFVNENQQKKRFFCMNCDVEYTWSVIRRYQLGYIQLISPVSHIWFLKANPSYLSLILDFRRSHLESIIYCTEAITLENLWKSSQTLGLDTSPSTLYSIWQKLLEEEKLIKRKHKEIKKLVVGEAEKVNKQKQELLFAKENTKNRNLTINSQLKQNKKHLNLMHLYVNNKDLFYKTKNIMYDYIQNSFYKNKILSNNQFYNYEKSYEKSLKFIYQKTFFQVLAFTNKTLLISNIDFFTVDNKRSCFVSSFDSAKSSHQQNLQVAEVEGEVCAQHHQLMPKKDYPLGGAEERVSSKILLSVEAKQKSEVKKQILSNIYEKEIMQFKDNFLKLAESFFQIYFIKLYLKDKNLIIQIPNNILKVFCEFFLFYCIQIQLDFYIKRNPLNNLPKILSINKKKKSSTYNKKNQIFYLKKIKEGNKKILKVSSKIKKGIGGITGFFYYTGICFFKKQIKLNTFFQKNKKIHLNFLYNKETTYKIYFNKKKNLLSFAEENVKFSLARALLRLRKSPSLRDNDSEIIDNLRISNLQLLKTKSESISGAEEPKNSIAKSFIQNVQSKKQTNLLQYLIREIYYKNEILSHQKNQKNASDILYLLYEFYKKEIVSNTCKQSLLRQSERVFRESLIHDNLRLTKEALVVGEAEKVYFFAPRHRRLSSISDCRKRQKKEKIPEIEYKQDKNSSMLSDIYSFNTFLNLFYIKNHKYKFSEIVNFNNLINYFCKISNNKAYKFTKKYNVKLVNKVYKQKKDKMLKIQSENLINLTKNCSNLNLNKKNTLNQRKKILFLQKQKSLTLRNPQLFSSIYSKKSSNKIYYSQFSESYNSYNKNSYNNNSYNNNKKPKERQYKENFRFHINEAAVNSKINEQNTLQKKMLKNDLYTISYSHLWPLNSDWKSFFYYNSAPKDFEDTYIFYSYRKESFYNKSNKFSTKLDILSQIDNIFISDSMIKDLGSPFGLVSFPLQIQKSTEDLKYKQIFFTEQPNSKDTYSLFHMQNTASLEPKIVFSESYKTYNNNGLPLPKKERETKVTKTTEFLSKMNSPLAGAAIVKKLLSEYTPSELKKMVKQHQVLLPKLNQNIRQLKEKAIKKLDFVKIQKLLNKRDHIIRRLKLIRKFSCKNGDPTSMILSVLPVLPPDLRPILKLQNQIAASDLNRLYQRIIYRNERLKKFLKDPSTSQSFEMKYAQRLLQEAVDNLIQNGKGNVKPETNSRGQALKSLSEILKGKQGRFRQYLLGKRVDYSGRSVIVVGPKLKLYECGLPKEMAIELFLPFLIKRILHYKIARTVIGAKNFLYSNKTYCINLLNEIMRNHPVLLNRAPTLHRLGIQAFQPKLVEGRAILLHPLVCPAFNADFDGDQMAVHLPITVEARAEAWTLIFSRNHLISPATGDPIVLPSQDMVLGCYYLTSEKKNIKRLQTHNKDFVNSPNKHLLPYYNPSKINKEAISFMDERSGFRTEDSKNNIKNENLNINEKKYNNFFCISNIFHLEKVLNAYQLGKISVQSIVWIKWKGKTQFANEPLSMIEIRLNRYGIRDQIHSKSYKRIDKAGNLLNQYIRTTPGRILINNIAQKCMLL